MADDINGASMDERLDSVMATLEKDPTLHDDAQDTEGTPTDPAASGNTELPLKDAIGEDQTPKPNEQKVGEPQIAAIEAPASWPSDDKEAFKSLPTWAQETIARRENEREAHFGERSRTMAAKEREVSDVQTAATQARQQHLSELSRLNQLATQLLPAKFSDIKSEADYLNLKVRDPARASEYEAFTSILRNAQQQQAQLVQQQSKQHLDREYTLLQEKYPEFKDSAKATELINDVRKAAVDWYGFTPQEVEIIADHRHVPIIRDAIAWRKYQATLKAAQGKKVPLQQPKAVLRSNGQNPGAVQSEEKGKILNRARGETDMRSKADLIVRALNIQS